MSSSQIDVAVRVAIEALEADAATPVEKIEMLLEMAHRLQQKPEDGHPLEQAIVLYDHALELSQDQSPLLVARSQVGKATALRSLPTEDLETLTVAKDLYESALPVLQQYGDSVERAETQMNLGLVMQSLVPHHRAQLPDCIRLYQEALGVFTANAYPQEFAILQNNIAIAYLSMTSAIGRDDLKQAIAIQTFEQALESISLIDHPSEYAMLQNNLGNALQYLPSTHPVDNNVRALKAYDEALKVRTAHDTPLVYAHTIANRANVLMNLPDDLENPENGNPKNLAQASTHYQEAEQIFLRYQQMAQAKTVRRAHAGIAQLLAEKVG